MFTRKETQPSPPKPSIPELVEEADNNRSILQVFIIRHGRTNENERHIIQGHLDTVLNEAGIKQATSCGDRVLKSIAFDAIWCSDLKRCLQTRDAAFRHHIIRSEYNHVTPLLRERAFGDLEGFQASIAFNILKQRKLTFESAGEDQHDFRRKLMKSWDSMVEEARHAGFERTAIVSHGGSISSLVHALINQRGFTFSDSIPTKHISGLLNTSITIVNITLGSSKNVIAGEIVEFNNAEHLTANVPAKDADESVEEEIVDNF
ncbi:histidine phosphatase superfamily [Kockiozyma suomiensis]|uniref:histidine phosphatase superfamily n=1 Tax=Kockiozyma suomiensis TaxID=1337062 RepID=UPI003343C4FB